MSRRAPAAARSSSVLTTLAVASALALGGAHAAAAQETSVLAARPVDVDDDSARVDRALATGNPEDALVEAGASLVHDGGPLSPARPLVRGLGGARLHVDVGGLSLADPATGLLDAGLLPWSAASRVVVDSGASLDDGGGEGGAIHLALDRRPGIRARVLAGSLSTARASLAASDGAFLVAADAGVTRGDFTFFPSSPVAASVPVDVTRDNNDQRRASILAAFKRRGTQAGDAGGIDAGGIDAGGIDVDGVAFAAGHDGGIAGMATSPTHGLRGEDAVMGAHLALGTRASPSSSARLVGDVDARVSHRATFGPDDPRSSIDSAGGGVGVGVARVAVGAAVVDVAASGEGAAIVGASGARGLGGDTGDGLDGGAPFSRIGAGGRVAARMPLGWLRVRGAVDGKALSDAGPLFSGEVRAEAGDALVASLGVARVSRAPTLDELYAPRGLVLGNPTLRPEAVDDVELAAGFVPDVDGRRVVEARAVLFAGYIEDAIAYVNRSAFTIAPVNLGGAWRAGIDISTTVEPSDWLALDLVAQALASQVAATRAPLPLAPPFSSRLAVRVGNESGPTAVAALRSRAAAPSNAFGTLKASPYSLLDLLVRVPLSDTLAAAASLENVCDVKDGRDQNQLPLPGRLLFLSLEVRG